MRTGNQGGRGVEVSIGELTRNVTALNRTVEKGFRDVHTRMDTELVPLDVYEAKHSELERRIASAQRSLNRFYGFMAALAVAVIGAGISAAGALVIALIFATRHH